MNKADFKKWFNNDFWKAFSGHRIHINIPENKERSSFLDDVFNNIMSSKYVPSIPEVELVKNKGHGVARTIPVFNIQDYCVYYFCIKELEDVLSVNRTPNTFGGWRLGGKLRIQEKSEITNELAADYGRYSFNPNAWTQAFGDFNSKLFAQLDSPGKFNYILQLDIANFYDSVRLDILERWIRENASADKSIIITLLFDLLNHWNKRNIGIHAQVVGLPHDAFADCSRILANFYLQEYDNFAANVCHQMDAIYFRYADDQMILLNDNSKIDNLLLLLTRKLDRFGLRVNQKKVRLWKTKYFLNHRCRNIQAIFSDQNSPKDPKLVKKFVKQYLSLSPKKLDASWNNGRPLLNRLLFTDLDSLPRSLFEKILIRLTNKSFLLFADCKTLKRINALNSRRSKPIDFNEVIKLIATKSVHNDFHHEAQAYAKALKNTDLNFFLDERIGQINKIMQDNIIEQDYFQNIDQ